jgi:hypothetical protein
MRLHAERTQEPNPCLTCTNTLPEKRKVAGSIPALATPIRAGQRLVSLTVTARRHQFANTLLTGADGAGEDFAYIGGVDAQDVGVNSQGDARVPMP